MHLPNHQTEPLTDLALQIRRLSESLMEGLEPAVAPITLAPGADIFADQPSGRLLLLREGTVHCAMDNKLITCFEAGDLLALPRTLNLPDGTYSCEDAITVQPIEREELIAHACSSTSLQKLWSYYLVAMVSWNRLALGQEITREFQPSAGFLHFAPGDTIIRQGDEADLVYTLLEGSAKAVCDGVKVGEIGRDEIFGALAVFTRQKRMASVVATDDCTVLTVRKEEFIQLVEHQPQICVGLIEEMADKINQLNNQLLLAQNKRA